jgi:ATP-dependent DNA helicase RecG
MQTRNPYPGEEKHLLNLEEDHFVDFKSAQIAPSKLQEAFVSFANSDGGDLYVGIEDKRVKKDRIRGYSDPEAANDSIHTLLEETKPAVENVESEFINYGKKGLVLHFSIPKSSKVHFTANGDCHIRINARKKRITGERVMELGYAKGAFNYEKQPVRNADLNEYVNSHYLDNYMKRVETRLAPDLFLKKQRLISIEGKKPVPNVGCVLLFDDEPQATLDTKCAIKIYRLRTSESAYKREQLESTPLTITGPIEEQIHRSINSIAELLEGASYEVSGKVMKLEYPAEAIHEILVNAVIHRDYSLNDDVHIKIYDNRIEIVSPGKLPGYITVNNIYDERFARNPNIVRMLHNLPDPVNHDIGEGLDTARNAMQKAGLVAPDIKELNNSVVIIIKHQKLAALADIIIDYLKSNPGQPITNKTVRELSGEDDVNKIKKAFQKLRRQEIIVPVDENAKAFDFQYVLSKNAKV